MARLIDRPDWRVCLSIIREEAAKAGVDPQDIIMAIRPRQPAYEARTAAIRRIIEETGCTYQGLSDVWGIGVPAIRTAIWAGREKPKRVHKGGRPRAPNAEVERLRQRLRWAHGDLKASQILAGNDPKTQADLAAWKSLGTRRAA